MSLKKKLEELTKELQENKDAINSLKLHGYDLERNRHKLMTQLVLESHPKLAYVDLYHDDEAEWGCSKSPTGLCVYDESEDPIHDDCLFCHKPQERK